VAPRTAALGPARSEGAVRRPHEVAGHAARSEVRAPSMVGQGAASIHPPEAARSPGSRLRSSCGCRPSAREARRRERATAKGPSRRREGRTGPAPRPSSSFRGPLFQAGQAARRSRTRRPATQPAPSRGSREPRRIRASSASSRPAPHEAARGVAPPEERASRARARAKESSRASAQEGRARRARRAIPEPWARGAARAKSASSCASSARRSRPASSEPAQASAPSLRVSREPWTPLRPPESEPRTARRTCRDRRADAHNVHRNAGSSTLSKLRGVTRS
jgi:hypothetical protein